MEALTYKYKIAITNSSQILSTGIYAKQFPSAEYITIESGEFARFRDCDRAMQKVLNEIGNEELVNGVKPVLVIQTNPNLEDGEMSDKVVEGWEQNVVLKSFLVNKDEVVKDAKTLHYSISGTIECSIVL